MSTNYSDISDNEKAPKDQESQLPELSVEGTKSSFKIRASGTSAIIALVAGCLVVFVGVLAYYLR